MVDFEYAQWLKRQHFRDIVNEWDIMAKTMQESAIRQGKKMLLREARHNALANIEEAARTEEDFDKVLILWEKRERRLRDTLAKKTAENVSFNDLESNDKYDLNEILPSPYGHIFWRQLLSGDFIDYIHDCPYEIHELTSSNPIFDFTKALDEDDKELLYLWAIRYWTPQQIAALREQSDRNIRKVYDVMITNIRRKLYFRLLPRYEANLPLTFAQREFVKEYIPVFGYDEIRRRKKKNLAQEVVTESEKEEIVTDNEN